MPEPTARPESDPIELLRGMVAQGDGNTPGAIMLRLLWLRQEHPDAHIATDPLHIADDRVVIRATITLPGGGSGSGIAAAAISGNDDWAASVEGTETFAISRALDTLGYVLRAATERQQPVTDTSPPASEPGVETATEPERDHAGPHQDVDPAQPGQPGGMQETAPPVVSALRRARRPQQAPEPPASESPNDGDDVHLEEYSWNSFWSRARELDLTPNRVTEILGRPANTTTPREAIADLIAAGAWPRENQD